MADLVEVTVKLPAELVRDAREFGVLNDTVFAELLRQEVDRRVNDVVNAEIQAYRQEKRAKLSDHS